MAFLTLISDYGQGSHYAASIKGTVYSQMPAVTIVDITHNINPHDVLQAAFILKNAAKDFPSGTVHIVCVDASYELHQQYLLAEWNGQLFIAADNGVLPLVFGEGEARFHVIKSPLIAAGNLFPEKHVFAPVAVGLMRGEGVAAFADPGQPRNVKQELAPVVEENLIRGSIVFVDGYDNAITNISKTLFDKKFGGKSKFAIFYRRREKITYISKNYHDVKGGREVALFNESGFLEIAMNMGHARQLLGLQVGGQIIVEFYE